MSNLVVNGAPVGPITIEPAWGSLAHMRRTLDRDGRDQVYFEQQGKLFVATGDDLHLRTYHRNIARLDGQPIKFVAADDQVDSVRNVAQRAYRRLPSLANPWTIGTVSVGTMAVTLLSGASKGAILRNGVIAAGVMAAGAGAVSYLRARHPEAFAGLLK